MTSTRRSAFAVAGLILLAAPACTRVERIEVEGVDCVVAKSGRSIRALDCNWPNEDDTNSPNSPQ